MSRCYLVPVAYLNRCSNMSSLCLTVMLLTFCGSSAEADSMSGGVALHSQHPRHESASYYQRDTTQPFRWVSACQRIMRTLCLLLHQILNNLTAGNLFSVEFLHLTHAQKKGSVTFPNIIWKFKYCSLIICLICRFSFFNRSSEFWPPL